MAVKKGNLPALIGSDSFYTSADVNVQGNYNWKYDFRLEQKHSSLLCLFQ